MEPELCNMKVAFCHQADSQQRLVTKLTHAQPRAEPDTDLQAFHSPLSRTFTLSMPKHKKV